MEEKEHSIATNVTTIRTNTHKISLSAEQLTSLQHGLAVQTPDGIRIKLEEKRQRKRSSLHSAHSRKYSALEEEESEDGSDGSSNNVLSLIQGYKTKKDPSRLTTHALTVPYAKVSSKSLDHQASMDGMRESEESASHESMYLLDPQKEEDTDGYITTPTAGRDADFEVKEEVLHNQNMGVLQEEGSLMNQVPSDDETVMATDKID